MVHSAKWASLASSVLHFNASAMDFFRIMLKQVTLSGKFYQLVLEVFVRQQQTSLLAHVYCGRDWATLLMNHCIRDCQRTAPIDAHNTVNKSASSGLPRILNDVKCDVEMLHHVVISVFRIKLDVAANSIAVEFRRGSGVTAVKR